MTLREILARREAIRVELNTIQAAHPAALPTEVETRWAALTGELATLSQQEQRQALVDELDRRQAQPLSGHDRQFSNLLDGYSLTRAIAASANLDEGTAGREREVSAELIRRSGKPSEGFMVPLDAVRHNRMEQRAILAAGIGAPLIATEVGPVIDRLRNASILRRAGATFLSGLSANVSFPALTGSVSAQWLIDGASLTETDPTLGAVGLTPHTIGALTEYSRQTLVQASPDVDDLIRNDMAQQVAAALDAAALVGSGTAGMPKGLVNTAGVNTLAMGANGGVLTYAAVVALAASVANLNGEGDDMAFVTNTKVRAAARGLLDTTGRPIGESVIFQNTPTFYSNTVASTGAKGTGTGLSSLFYGAWSNLLIGQFGDLTIVSNPFGDGYNRGAVVVRILASYDVAPRNPQAFGYIADLAA